MTVLPPLIRYARCHGTIVRGTREASKPTMEDLEFVLLKLDDLYDLDNDLLKKWPERRQYT
jgi:hypothetical protein